MNQSKVHSKGKVPFSWENKPGVCKETTEGTEFDNYFLQKLPPPETEKAKIPPPPCANFHPPSRTSSGRGLKKSDDDPFLAAYKECTKSTTKGNKLANLKDKKGMFNFSCKESCSVRTDNLVKISQLHPEKERSGIEM